MLEQSSYPNNEPDSLSELKKQIKGRRAATQKMVEKERAAFSKAKKINKQRKRPFKDQESYVHWGVYDSKLADFDGAFRRTLGENTEGVTISTIAEYIVTHYAGQELNVMELGGPGSKLWQELQIELNKKAKEMGVPAPILLEAVGVVLTDVRSKELKLEEEKHSRHVIEADVFSRKYGDQSGWEEVEDYVEKYGKQDFIIERMVDPVNEIGNKKELKKYFLLNTLRWFKVLKEGGTMLIQVPSLFIHYQTAFLDVIDEINNPKPLLDVSVNPFGFGLRVRRLPGCPDNIDEFFRPHLDD